MAKAVTAAAPGEEATLDRSAFTETVSLKALRVPTARCQELMKKFSGYTFRQPRMRCIAHDGNNKATRLLLLAETVKGDDLEGLRPDLKELVQQDGLEVTEFAQELGYSYWPAEHILKKLLPEGVEVPSSFETIGHIAHLNIRDDLLAYKHIIGQVIMDKNLHIKTVVNKVGNISSQYRVFDMEVVAGENKLVTEVTQYKARFQLDFSKVYWNSRLETEHKRLVDLFKPSNVICDIMAGIGPFAVPAAQKGCQVYANDLNPDSYSYLQKNIQLNKVASSVHPYNMDGRKFIRLVCGAADVDSQTPEQPSTTELPAGGRVFQHAVMNLPDSAVTFLDAFNGAFNPDTWAGTSLPTIHCYTFCKANSESETSVRSRVEAALGGTLDAAPTIHIVRDVAPGKRMLCVSFPMPASIAYRSQQIKSTQSSADAGAAGTSAAPAHRRPSDSDQLSPKRQKIDEQ